MYVEFICSGKGQVAGCCVHDYGSVKGRKFLEKRSDYQLLKKPASPCSCHRPTASNCSNRPYLSVLC